MVWSYSYEWGNYQASEDLNHSIDVERKKKESDNISQEYFITGAWDWNIGGNLSGYVIVNGIGSSGTLSGYDTKGELLNSGHWKYDRNKKIFIRMAN